MNGIFDPKSANWLGGAAVVITAILIGVAALGYKAYIK